MIDLRIFYTNPFADLLISYENKRLASEEHIGKLKAQNTHHQYDEMYAITLEKHENYFGEISGISIKTAVQKTQTGIVNKIIADFKKRTTKLHFYLVSNGIKDTPLFTLFFPKGVMAYTRKTNKGNIESYLNVLVKAISEHTAEAGGASVLAEYQAFQTSYKDMRKLQNKNIGATRGGRTNRNTAEKEWADQMFSNLLLLAHEYRNEPEKMSLFFTQHYLRRKKINAGGKRNFLGGLITRKGTGEPEENVTIHVIDADIADTFSKAKGKYRTKKLPIGFQKVRYSKPGMLTQELTVEIKDVGTTIQNVEMEMALPLVVIQ